ncbi:MAG: hypothetical protein Solivirus1_16 [Solivirus sp.]|uniref:Uncharacterized protein n=1 Tax=Solivirus sp. TaxID=2487772 RepID=A0A3G5AJP8_9VIRU|nr:MAG: hypothetical protein Solivirus1_16 [Solivirus sp.]
MSYPKENVQALLVLLLKEVADLDRFVLDKLNDQSIFPIRGRIEVIENMLILATGDSSESLLDLPPERLAAKMSKIKEAQLDSEGDSNHEFQPPVILSNAGFPFSSPH